MNAIQDELALGGQKAPEPTKDEIEQLLAVLRGHGGWLHAAEICAMERSAGRKTDERTVRAMASAAAPAVVSYPGSRGYKLWEFCTLDEINNCINSLDRQGKLMMRRSHLFRQAYYRRFPGADLT